MPTTSRITKRPFQPSITSFFARTDREDAYPSRSESLSAQLSPPLPAIVQSSLLNVGMRVRKSVPEGYKTGSYCSLGAPSNPKSRIREEHGTGGNPDYCGSGRGFAELTPYCGILKIGGLSSQSTRARNPIYQPLRFDDESDDYGFPPSSQDSYTSTISNDSMPATPPSMPSNTKKRHLEDDEEEYSSPNAVIWEEDNGLHLPSPRSYPVSHTHMPRLDFLRPKSLPTTRRRWHATTSRKEGIFEGQENVSSVDGGDFEEAKFFKPHEWADGEFEMGGI
ncbi:MAG: hypothetical protein M1827_006107 [Pycnora praestabilis]|nr:MAG: hypothetical protein M1827_006107 [Pycnora praestabilis]